MKKKIFISLGAVMILASLIMSLILISPLKGEQVLRFASTYKDRAVTLEASYFESEGAEYGVLLCPGYSCDRQKLNAVASIFRANGMSVFTFDYAGQGASSSTIGFDNAKTDAISVEIADAMDEFHAVSGIPYENMILVGHSMGGRAILRLLYDVNCPDAETDITPRPVGYAILAAPAVNYYFSAQSSLFSQTNDETEEPWLSYNESYIEGTDVYIYGSTFDDVVSDGDIWAIYEHLGGTPSRSEGVGSDSCVNALGSKLSAEVVAGPLHSFQLYTVKFARLMNKAVEDITGEPSVYPAGRFALIFASWILVCLGAGLLVTGFAQGPERAVPDTVPDITDMKRFLRRKLLMWLPGIAFAFLICCLCVVSPWGSPIMNVPYMCFIAGYGLWMLLCYRSGRFGGTVGALPRPTLKCPVSFRAALPALLVTAAVSFIGWLTLRTTVFRLFPLNFRLPWLLFAGGLMTVGYYVSGVEEDMLEKAGAGAKERFLYGLINYVPLFLFAGFYVLIGSWSGLVQQLINVAFMYVVFIPMGDLLRKALKNRLYGALATAFLFQGMMLTSAALIAMF